MSSVKILHEPHISNFRADPDSRYLTALTHSTWSTKLPSQLAQEWKPEEYDRKFELANNAMKAGYGSIAEVTRIQSEQIIPRYATLAAVSFYVGGTFLQQSLRYTLPQVTHEQEARSIIFVPDSLEPQEKKIAEHHEKALELYKQIAKSVRVLPTRKPEEEARTHLGWHTGTFIYIPWNLHHLGYANAFIKRFDGNQTPTIWKHDIEEQMRRLREKDERLAVMADGISKDLSFGKFYPGAYPFKSSTLALEYADRFPKDGKNAVELISYDLGPITHMSDQRIRSVISQGRSEGSYPDLAFVSFLFAIKDSGIARHEIIRHRTILQQSISIQDTIRRSEVILSAPLRNLFDEDRQLGNAYAEHLKDSQALYDDLGGYSNPDAVGVMEHNYAFVTIVQLNGYNIFNARGFLGNRCCKLAQTETENLADLMNGKINEVLKKEGKEDLTKITHANCFKLGRCPEIKRRAEKCTIYNARSFERELFPIMPGEYKE